MMEVSWQLLAQWVVARLLQMVGMLEMLLLLLMFWAASQRLTLLQLWSSS